MVKNNGSVVEWSMALVLKTRDCNRSVSSNLTASAKHSQMRELVKSASLERSAFERAQGFESLSDCHGELGEWLNQQIANLSLRNRRISSILILSAKLMPL